MRRASVAGVGRALAEVRAAGVNGARGARSFDRAEADVLQELPAPWAACSDRGGYAVNFEGEQPWARE